MLSFIDINCRIGRLRAPYPYTMTQTDQIKKELQRCHVAKAFCSHYAACEHHSGRGNVLLWKEIQEDSFFQPVYVIEPNHTGDTLSLQEMPGSFSVAAMLPDAHGFSMSSLSVDETLAQLCDKHILLLLNFNSLSPEELHRILSRFPALNVIVTDTSYVNDKKLYPLLSAHSNLYLETGGYTTNDGIELIAERFGAERLIFGSGMPQTSVSASVGKILFSRLSEEQKELIAHRNLERLLGKELL